GHRPAAGRRRRPLEPAGAPPRLVHLLVGRGVRAAAERGGRLLPQRVRAGRPVRRVVRRLRGRRVQPPRGPSRAALLLYPPRGGLGGLFRQMVRYGRGRARLSRKHPDTFSLRGFVPAAFVAGLLLGPLLAILSPLLAVLYAGTLGLYAAVVLMVSLTIALRA